MEISAASVKELRERAGVGFMDCKKALKEAGGDMDEAIKILRTMGKAKAAKKAGRQASEGRIDASCVDALPALLDRWREVVGAVVSERPPIET